MSPDWFLSFFCAKQERQWLCMGLLSLIYLKGTQLSLLASWWIQILTAYHLGSLPTLYHVLFGFQLSSLELTIQNNLPCWTRVKGDDNGKHFYASTLVWLFYQCSLKESFHMFKYKSVMWTELKE
jgi:hypothetical protein